MTQMQQTMAVNGSSSSVAETDGQIVLLLREKISKLEKALEKCEEEKYTLECRIEQRHLQVGTNTHWNVGLNRDIYRWESMQFNIWST